jgi:hypothetical protein
MTLVITASALVLFVIAACKAVAVSRGRADQRTVRAFTLTVRSETDRARECDAITTSRSEH